MAVEGSTKERIVISSDHAGYRLKERLKGYLEKMGFEVIDEGVHSPESSDYPDDALRAALRVSRGEVKRGITLCGTGIGASIAANKVPGVRAALCLTPEFARLSREHNDANMLVLSGRFLSYGRAVKVLKTWLETPFSQGPNHVRRIGKLAELDRKVREGLLVWVAVLSVCVSEAAEFVWEGPSLEALRREAAVVAGTERGMRRRRLVAAPDRPWEGRVPEELRLEFDGPVPRWDATGRYAVRSFRVTRGEEEVGVVGGFLSASDRVVLVPPEGGLFAETEDLGSFTVSLRMKPLRKAGVARVLERKVLVGGDSYGMVVELVGGRVVFRLERMWFDLKGEARSFVLKTGRTGYEPRWVHVVLDYDRLTGRLRLSLDGEEQDVVWATVTGGPEAAVLVPRFTGRSDLVVGGDGFGYLAELVVLRGVESDEAVRQAGPRVARASVTTPVLTNRFSNARLEAVVVDNEERPRSVKVWVRSAPEPFAEDAVRPAWSVWRGGEEVRGRYMQVRLEWGPEASVESLRVRVAEMAALEPPTDVRLVVEGGRLVVRWRPVEDGRVAGYRVTVEGSAGLRRELDAGGADVLVVEGLRAGEEYRVTVRSYDGSVPVNLSGPSAPRSILFAEESVR